MRVAYEALAWGRHVSEYDHAWRLVQAADHPALGVCLDSFHILSRGTRLDAIGEIPADKLFFLQLADAPHLVMDVLQWSRHYRCFPGQGGFDLAGFTRRVLDAGYDGPLSLEVFNDVFRQADPERMAVDAMRSLLVLEESVGAGPPLPAPAPLRGYAFAELAVEPASAGEIQRVLHALGFSQAAQHRTKPVTLWRSAGARVLLNAGASATNGIAAIAVESADPTRSAQRAEALLAPVLDRHRGPAEADLAAVAAPDGTSVFFCRTDERAPASWLQDFDALAPAGGPRGGGRRAHRPHRAGPAVGLLRRGGAVLPLRARARAAREPRAGRAGRADPQPRGRQRRRQRAARAQRSAAGRRPAAPGRAPAHRARLPRTCSRPRAAMRERGVTPLAIPANYYDDLAARWELEPGLIEAMRELGVLYDRDAGGELLHFYTPVVGGRLFFEVVQRRGAYGGYGAANSPVRMSAQRAPVAVAVNG